MTIPFCDTIVCGDSLELLARIPDNSIDLVITSPPYFQQRDYGAGIGNEKTVEEYIESLLKIFQNTVRVTKPTGSIVWNLGDKYENSSLLLVPYRFAVAATTTCNVKLVNKVTWVKSNPTPRQFRRRLVNSTEPFFHFVKTDDYKYYPECFLAHENHSHRKANGQNTAIGAKYFNLIEQSNLNAEQKQKARKALDEAIQEVKRGEITGLRMKIRGIHAEPFGGQDGGRKIQLEQNGFTIIRLHGQKMKKDVIETPVENIKGCPHPAIYPVSIVREFISLLTDPEDIILDPFVGAGSSAVAAKQLGRHYIGFDIVEDYCKYAIERLDNMIYQPGLQDLLF